MLRVQSLCAVDAAASLTRARSVSQQISDGKNAAQLFHQLLSQQESVVNASLDEWNVHVTSLDVASAEFSRLQEETSQLQRETTQLKQQIASNEKQHREDESSIQHDFDAISLHRSDERAIEQPRKNSLRASKKIRAQIAQVSHTQIKHVGSDAVS